MSEPPFIHRTAICQSDSIGANSKIWQFCVVLAGARVGENCNINCHCFLENEVSIGNNVTVKSGVYLWDGVTIEDDVFIGPNVTFTNDRNPRSKHHKRPVKTIVRRGASVGGGVTILPGVEIGENAMVGAGSVVTRNVPPNATVAGNPARILPKRAE